jgi:hypothetical protein
MVTGGDLPGKRDLGRFVKWPKYVRLQRQKAVLLKRLKVPPAIAQFANTLDKASATELFRLLDKYRPETREDKKARLTTEAESVAAGGAAAKGPKPVVVKYGINHVTALIEKKKAQLVVIAHDVEPIEVHILPSTPLHSSSPARAARPVSRTRCASQALLALRSATVCRKAPPCRSIFWPHVYSYGEGRVCRGLCALRPLDDQRVRLGCWRPGPLTGVSSSPRRTLGLPACVLPQRAVQL